MSWGFTTEYRQSRQDGPGAIVATLPFWGVASNRFIKASLIRTECVAGATMCRASLKKSCIRRRYDSWVPLENLFRNDHNHTQSCRATSAGE